MRFFSYTKARGFTLVELLVVIAIIGILASIISVSLTAARAKGRDSKRVADIRTIQLALEEFYNDNGYYPASLYGTTGSIAPTYIASVPYDPNSTASSPIPYLYSAYNAVPNSACLTTNKPVKYHLAAVMESTAASNSSLSQDVDYSSGGATVCTNTTADFNGLAASCVGTTAQSPASLDNCYDVTN